MAGQTADPRFEPPLPKAVYKVVNPALKLLLSSPFHRLISGSLMVLAFRGRKTGRRYTLPVGYLQNGDRLLVFTHSRWWKNLRGGAPVTVRLRGRTLEGVATPIDDPQAIASATQQLVARHGSAMARRMGIIAASPGTSGQVASTPQPAVKYLEIQVKR